MIHESILGTIGNTPVVKINHLAPANTTIYVKCEAFNPLSQILTINNMAIAKVGEYTFIVFVDNDLKAEVPLSVVFAEAEHAEEQLPAE